MELKDDIRQMIFLCEQKGLKAVVDPGQLQRLLDELEAAERDLAKAEKAANHWTHVAIRHKEGEQALAAHVSVLESIINGSDLTDRTEVMSALNSAPETSLARLIAQKQAEVLEQADSRMPVTQASSRIIVRKMARELRRQAEEKK